MLAAKKTFVVTKLCLLRQKTSFTFCRDKQTFVATKDVFCREKNQTMLAAKKTFVVTKLCLLRQKTSFKFCRDKQTFVETKDVFCRDKHVFVATNTCLSREMHVCFDKTFVATEMILVAPPANDRYTVGGGCSGRGGSGGGFVCVCACGF